MFFEELCKQLADVGHTLTSEQKEALARDFGSKRTVVHVPILSTPSKLHEATVNSTSCVVNRDFDTLILHENGVIDRSFDETEVNSYGFVFWGDDKEAHITLVCF